MRNSAMPGAAAINSSEMSEQKQTSITPINLTPTNAETKSKSSSPARSGRSRPGVEQEKNIQQAKSNTSPSRRDSHASSSTTPQQAPVIARPEIIDAEISADTQRDSSQRLDKNTPSWPTSPRLKSPPPTIFKSIHGRRSENDTTPSNTSVRRLAPASNPDLSASTQVQQESSKDQNAGQSNHRTSGRGASAQGTGLETVAEGSAPSTPSIGPVTNQNDTAKLQVPLLERDTVEAGEVPTNKDGSNHGAGDTGSRLSAEKAETAPSSRAPSTSRPATNLAKRSFTSLTGKSKTAIEPLRTMTIETETVSSTPQIITDRGKEGGSVRAKPSTETIRPKKEKKKPPRKAPSLHAGMNSSKADIFEAKVASAVDEADSSDSDETFVYESNPPEPRPSRHHSRTPSATSLASQIDHHGMRGKHGVRSGSTAIAGKKSMKFSNSMHGSQLDAEGSADGRGSTHSKGTTQRHHYVGRYGRSGHPSIVDTDTPFTQAKRSVSPQTPTARNSRPNSPRTANSRLYGSRKTAAAGYDTYDDGADDERAPLMGSVRINRNRHSRRPNSGHFRPMEFSEDSDPGCWPRLRGCIFLGIFVMLVSIGVAIFVVTLNRSLVNVEITRIENVLASEQELMLDLLVQATNPNLFSIAVSDLDVNLFAESPYVGTTSDWEKQASALITSPARLSAKERRESFRLDTRRIPFWFPPYHPNDGVDEGTDPIDDPESGTQKMLLGRIFEFDSPLVFEPSPLQRSGAYSIGEIRLAKPGNRTEVGGSARWETVLQHPFDLIVRGVIKYQLPLSSSPRSAKISGRITVSPGDDSGDKHGVSSTLETGPSPSQPMR